MTTLTHTQNLFFNYIADEARTARVSMLEGILATGALADSQNDASVIEKIDRFLTDNPHNFCEGGIQRARAALNIPEKPKYSKGDTVQESSFWHLKPGIGLTADGLTYMIVSDGYVCQTGAKLHIGDHPNVMFTIVTPVE
jgi:hypothetical protein